MTDKTNSSDYKLVSDAIAYLEQRQLDQPSLEDVASHVGVSPHHLQRVFTRWAGISPKRFLQYLTLSHAKRLLAESRPILDAAYEVGLSGPSRLHDLFVTVEGVTPGEYKALGAGLTIAFGCHETPFGDCLLAVTDRGVCGLSFLDDDSRRSETWAAALADLRSTWPEASMVEQPDVTGPIAERIFSRTHDSRRPLALFLKGTNFQMKVWEALLTIPEGTVTSYGDVARNIEMPTASRAVGSAVGGNNIAYLIPCHRVIRSSGVISDYRWGSSRKRAILAWEAAAREQSQAAD